MNIPPLNHGQRIANYWLQNGIDRLTPRQRRRAEHKFVRAHYRKQKTTQ